MCWSSISSIFSLSFIRHLKLSCQSTLDGDASWLDSYWLMNYLVQVIWRPGGASGSGLSSLVAGRGSGRTNGEDINRSSLGCMISQKNSLVIHWTEALLGKVREGEGSNTSMLKVENSRISTSTWTQIMTITRILVNGMFLQEIPNSRMLFGKDKLARDWNMRLASPTSIFTWWHLNVRNSFSTYKIIKTGERYTFPHTLQCMTSFTLLKFN